jgi:hypothetical protein
MVKQAVWNSKTTLFLGQMEYIQSFEAGFRLYFPNYNL